MGPTLRRYFLREVTVPFLFGIGVFTFILLVARMLKLVELVVNRGVPIVEIGKLFAYILPTFLEVTVPMALLLAVLAKRGFIVSSEETHTVTLRLLDGNIHTFMPGERSYHKTDFSVYDVTLNLAAALAKFSQREKEPEEMTIPELRAAIAERQRA